MKGYALEKIRDEARAIVVAILGHEAAEHIRVEFPPPGIGADLAIPLFPLARVLKRNPNEMASEVAGKVDPAGSYFERISAAKGFVNFHFDWKQCNNLFFDDFLSAGEAYGSAEIGSGKTIVIDYSAPNIAKPFSVGHLRSTVIGQALYNILTFLGYTVIGDNHIGDWGTQFGKILAAYDLWGDEKALEESPTRALLDLYVRFHDEVAENPSLEQPAREWFARLEAGDDTATQLWSRFRELSLREFERIYDLLGVSFDHTLGESFYNDRLKGIVKRALESGVAEWSTVPDKDEAGRRAAADLSGADVSGEEASGAEIADNEQVILIPLAKYGISAPLILQKSDGTSLYATRELATLEHRVAEWHPHEVLYVVGAEQSLYFRQFFKAIELLGIEVRCVHVPFGLIRLPEGRMSTRKGRVIFLEDLLREAIERAGEIVKDRDLSDEEKQEIARLVGVGAVKYADLSQDRTKDIVFDWKKMMALEGNSGPYLQYAYTRAASIIKKSAEGASGAANGGDGDGVAWEGDLGGLEQIDPAALTAEEETALIHELARFPEVIKQAAGDYKPNYIANHLFSLSQVFNRFYVNCAVLKAETPVLRDSRLALVAMTAYVLKRGLGLLGIDCPEKM